MRTCNTKSLWGAICGLRTWDPNVVTPASLGVPEQWKYTEFMNNALERGWNAEYWPDTMRTEERQYRATYDADRNYAADDEVYAEDSEGTGGYYVSLQDNNKGNDPTTETTWWAAVETDFVASIDFRQAGETEMARVAVDEAVFWEDPRTLERAAVVAPVIVENEALVVLSADRPLKPWVRFQAVCPRVSLIPWAADEQNAIGDVRYLAATGYSYAALQASTGKNPENETDYWEPMGIPEFLRMWVALTVAAVLSAQDETRNLMLGMAQAELQAKKAELVRAQVAGNRRAIFRR